MNYRRPDVPLRELLTRSTATVVPNPEKQYREVTVRLWGRGVTHRRLVTGAEVAGQRRFVTHARQLILSRIDARNGAIGLVPPDLEGAVVSNDFPTFDINTSRLLPEYLGWLCRTTSFVEECARASEGTTNRVRLQEGKFLAQTIPLPPLPEQQRIVARLEAAAAHVQQACALRQQAAAFSQAVMRGKVLALRSASTWPDLPLEDVCDILDSQRRPVNVTERSTRLGSVPYYGAGRQVGWIDQYLFDESLVLLAEDGGPFDWRCAYLVEGKSWVNNHAHVLRGTIVDNRWLAWMLRSTDMGPYLSGSTRAKLPQSKMRLIPIPTPPMSDQLLMISALDSLAAKLTDLTSVQEQRSAQLDALLPAILDRAFKGEL